MLLSPIATKRKKRQGRCADGVDTTACTGGRRENEPKRETTCQRSDGLSTRPRLRKLTARTDPERGTNDMELHRDGMPRPGEGCMTANVETESVMPSMLQRTTTLLRDTIASREQKTDVAL